MPIRKNTKRIDPRYFLNEKREIIKEEIEVTLDERVRDRDGSGGSGFAGDARNRTPEQEKAHQAKVRAMRAKEPKTERQLATAWLAKQPKEVQDQADDYARMNAEDHESYQQLYAAKALELYNKRKRVTEEQDDSTDVPVRGGGVRSVKGVKRGIMENLKDAMQAAQQGDFEAVATRVANLEAFVQALKKVGEIK